MSPVFVDKPSPTTKAPPPVKRVDDLRGTWGMALFIATEAALFLAMFFAYYYTDKKEAQWRGEIPPKLHYSLPMLGVLLTSSVVLHWGEKKVKKQEYGKGRIALIGTIVLGCVFLFLTYLEDMEHLQHLTPRTDAYGSIFYAIISLHGAHVTFGVLMMLWVLAMGRWQPALYTPHRPYHNVA
ncbi:MAG TPA: cytochrome c oxidase subunit 3, partial [Dongiaceae bacterium]|nr:cytochrome c oxidase subunit 3 [Dongiaceae bacterium]